MPARNSGMSFIWSASLFAWLSNWPMRQVRGDADAGLERGQGDLGLLRQALLGDRRRDVRRDALQRLRVDLGRVEHVLGALRARQARLGGAGLVSARCSACSMRSRAKSS